MKKVLACFVLIAAAANCRADVILGSASDFGVLAGTTITNAGNSAVYGEIGVNPGTAVVGFPPGIAVGGIHLNDMAAARAEADLASACLYLSGLAPTANLTDLNLGGSTLTSGVYRFDAAADLNGALTLSGSGIFLFQIATSLNIANDSLIVTSGGANAAEIYFLTGSSVTTGASAALQGNFIAMQSISFGTGSSLTGRALAIEGAVTMLDNAITIPAAAPEPGTLGLVALIAALGYAGRRTKPLG